MTLPILGLASIPILFSSSTMGWKILPSVDFIRMYQDGAHSTRQTPLKGVVRYLSLLSIWTRWAKISFRVKRNLGNLTRGTKHVDVLRLSHYYVSLVTWPLSFKPQIMTKRAGQPSAPL